MPMIPYLEQLQSLKNQTVTSALQLLAQAGREDCSVVQRRDVIETCNRVLETLAGKVTTSLHKHVSTSNGQNQAINRR